MLLVITCQVLALRSEVYFLQPRSSSIRQSELARGLKLGFTIQLHPCREALSVCHSRRSTYVTIQNAGWYGRAKRQSQVWRKTTPPDSQIMVIQRSKRPLFSDIRLTKRRHRTLRSWYYNAQRGHCSRIFAQLGRVSNTAPLLR